MVIVTLMDYRTSSKTALEQTRSTPDTDDDGYPDGEEVTSLSSDPLDPCDPDPAAISYKRL